MRRKLLRWMALGILVAAFLFAVRGVVGYLRSPRLQWPSVSISALHHQLIRQADGTLVPGKSKDNIGFVAPSGAILRAVSSEVGTWSLDYNRKSIWQGHVNQISAVDDEIAIVTNGSEREHFPIQTVRFLFPSLKKTIFPNEWHCLSKNGTAIAYEPSPGLSVEIDIHRPDKKGKIITSIESLGLLTGIDTNGSSTVYATGNDVYFQSNKDSWRTRAGLMHHYRSPRLVDDESCIVSCHSESSLLYSGNWIELMNKHRILRTQDDTYSRWLLVHDDAKRVAGAD